ncbi:MAG: GntR family transcriptional regulator [Rhodomicrobium sp.]|nr:GntR family transcriptional regulator [Rhodomicrobium sp.]
MSTKLSDSKPGERSPAIRPLYAQVRDILIERIGSGEWQPGALIPNEFAIARELGVSQGTIRKALDALAAEHLLVRRQGRGTYVAAHTPAEMLFRFFNFFDETGERIVPDTHDFKLTEGLASRQERERLSLADGERVFRIRRIRTRQGAPFILETISLPARLFPRLGDEAALPNTLYDHFQKAYGVTVAGGRERLTAVIAGEEEAKALGATPGCALLKLDRVMLGLQGRPLEWRVSLCLMDGASYVVEFR